MNLFDVYIISFLNSFARHSWPFDLLVSMVAMNSLIKGGVVTALIWWAWFRPRESKIHDREFLLCGILSSFLAVLVSRTLADILPFRERPLRNPNLHFQIPYGTDQDALIHWSSFPSDHAALFFALSISILFVSRGAGIFTLVYSFLVVCLPRIYLGFHYPTDILGGALIGIGLAHLAKITFVRARVALHAMGWLEKYPGVFYSFFFLVTFQIAITFDSVRDIARTLLKICQHASS